MGPVLSPTKVCGLAFQRDRGYAWLILLASYLPQIASIGFAYSVAVFQQAWMAEFQGQHSKALISAIGSVNCASLFCTGVLASVLIEKLGHRLTVVIGTLLTTIGYIFSFFSVNIWMVLIGYGIFVGMGFGLIYMGSVTIVSLWFERYRALACGIAASGNGIGTFINALLLDLFIKHSGWRATMLYQACIVAQVAVVAMLFRSPPVPRRDEAASPLNTSTNSNQAPPKKPGFFADAAELFKNPRFIAFFINNWTWPVGIIVFYAFCVRLAIDVGGFELSLAVWAVSCIGLIDGCARIISGIISSSFNVSPSVFYFLGQFGYGIVIIIAPFLNAYTNPFVSSALFGFFFGCQLGTLVTTTAELFDPEKISTVFGILIVANGFGNGLGPIIADLLLEGLGGSYRLVYMTFGIIVLVGLMVAIPVFVSHWQSLRRSRKAKRSQPEKNQDINDSAFGILNTDGRNEEL